METCEGTRTSNHEMIVWDGIGSCPLCVALEEVGRLQGEVADLKDELRGMEREVEKLEGELSIRS